MELINGLLYHTVGASSAALCYTPQKKVKGWSWQTYWLSQAFVCWFLLPVLVAWFTIPQLGQVLKEAPAAAMRDSFLLGMAYGIGGTAFGMAIRYVGFSLTYAISVGISCVLGTLLPPWVNGTLGELLNGNGGNLLISGIVMGAIGISLCGWAGRNKERDIAAGATKDTSFSLAKGLPLCLLAGVLSALYGFSIAKGKPIADIAAVHGAGEFRTNVIYIFSNTGAFVTTLLYCLYLHTRGKTFSEFGTTNKQGSLALNYGMATLTGLLWYGQFFFYGLGTVRISKEYTSWALHMILLVILSSLIGVLMKEWKGTQRRTVLMLVLALLVLVIAVLLIMYGNKIATA